MRHLSFSRELLPSFWGKIETRFCRVGSAFVVGGFCSRGEVGGAVSIAGTHVGDFVLFLVLASLCYGFPGFFVLLGCVWLFLLL